MVQFSNVFMYMFQHMRAKGSVMGEPLFFAVGSCDMLRCMFDRGEIKVAFFTL